eukprot:scpid67893/ scgid22093/ 2-acylglycerol O-acyltransferase 2; Acyl-CoA:monoacylglycerol acyltransferase 2; Diacylglycerol acyltransferase 2-like protein 5; Monoacylglycerol O-acyltransferase 1-like; Monoacylglycerol O-acyltransferase 2
MAIKFAPISIPLSRRLQTASVLLFILLFLVGHVSSWFALVLFALNPFFTPFVILYLFWVFHWDKQTPFNGGRPFRFMRRLAVWRYFRDYFPIALRSDNDNGLDASVPYVFGCHPHGVGSAGAVCNFTTDVTGFDRLFPGVDVRLMTLDVQFDMPIWRDLLMAQGLCSVSKHSCLHCLEHGTSIAIVVGGAAEALDARPGCADLTLASRRGFVKLAMMSGASLVPTFSFGENDIYNQVPNPPGSRLRELQKRFTKTMGFSPPLFHGRGIFNYTFGLMPHRRPVTTIVGKPIAVEKAADLENLDREEVDRIWNQYVDGLRELFDAHKTEFGFSESDTLNIS